MSTAVREPGLAHSRAVDVRPPGAIGRRGAAALGAGLAAVLLLALVSVFVGVADVTPAALLDPTRRADALEVLWISRVPRTVALVLAGSCLAVCGLIMQLLTRNPFVEPSTTGTMEFAGAGLLVVALLAPDAPVVVRMLVGALAALAGTALFMRVLAALPLRDVLVVPLVGIVLSGVIGAVSTFVAYRFDLVQSLNGWLTGDFSAVVEGRYEMLYVAAVLAALAYLTADRFTVAGLGADMATNLGLSHRATTTIGVGIVAVTTATVVVTVGMLGFVGLVVPNVVVGILGANARRAVPWVALGGAVLVLACDLLARTLRHPYELPIGTVLGVVGAIGFLVLVLRGERRAR